MRNRLVRKIKIGRFNCIYSYHANMISAGLRDCPSCDGHGTLVTSIHYDWMLKKYSEVEIDCPRCKGEGLLDWEYMKWFTAKRRVNHG